jgi:hypothetical protein
MTIKFNEPYSTTCQSTLWILLSHLYYPSSGFLLVSWAGATLSPFCKSATIWPIVPAPDDDECAADGGMIGRGNWSTQRKPAPVSLCLPQIPHDLTQTQTYTATVGSQQLTAWAMAWPSVTHYSITVLNLSLCYLLCMRNCSSTRKCYEGSSCLKTSGR